MLYQYSVPFSQIRCVSVDPPLFQGFKLIPQTLQYTLLITRVFYAGIYCYN